VASCYGSKVGLYHAAHLPLLLLVEMEGGEPGFLGAVDELSLVLVCAGICAGNLAAHRAFGSSTGLSGAELDLCRRGLRTNLWFGDFVECCYPFMEASRFVSAGGYLGSALSSGYLVAAAESPGDVPRSMAYLPLPVSVALAGGHWRRYAGACALAAGVPFAATLLRHAARARTAGRHKKKQKQQ
jgi:hypothetical protein